VRNVYIVGYDIVDDKRRTKAHAKLKGFGEPLQYSLFRCILSETGRLKLRAALWELIDHAEDRVVLIDLGPDDGRGRESVETWGKALEDPAAATGPGGAMIL
jgi:CRISPR-associated protein Cas2